jgi:hypothetical protein
MIPTQEQINSKINSKQDLFETIVNHIKNENTH